MRKYDYSFIKNIGQGQLFRLSNMISEINAKETIQKKDNEKAYNALVQQSIIESMKGSNAIENIITTDKRIKELANGSLPITHNEKEILGYREVLNIIHKENLNIEVNEKSIRLFHKTMEEINYKDAGEYKTSDNDITEIHPDGTKTIRFVPVPAADVESNMKQMLSAYYDAEKDIDIHPLILMSCFVVDFLCIHPFRDGNGRISRLLTLLIMYKCGYDIGKYISIEAKINEHKYEYYEALQLSSVGWHENKNDYTPFIIFMFQIIYLCYKQLNENFMGIVSEKVNKSRRIEYVINNSLVPISKSQISERLPDISIKTIELELSKMLKEKKIKKIGTYKNARYISLKID